MKENKKITIQDIKNALLITNNQKIEGAPFGGGTIDFRLKNNKLEFSRKKLSGEIEWINIEGKSNTTYLDKLKNEAGSLLKAIQEKNEAEAKARLEKELEKQKEERKLKDIEDAKKQEEEKRLKEIEDAKKKVEEQKLKDAQDEALSKIKENLNNLPGLAKKEGQENENHDLVFDLLIKDKNLEDLQKIADKNAEDFEQLVKNILVSYLNKEVDSLKNIEKTVENDDPIIGLDNNDLDELLPLLDKENLKNHLQKIANNKTTADLVSRLEILGAGDQSKDLAVQILTNKGVNYVGELLSSDKNDQIAIDILTLKLGEIKDDYRDSVFKKIFDSSQNQDRENPQNLATNLINIAINEDNLQKAIVDSYKKILEEKLINIEEKEKNPLRKEAIDKIRNDINNKLDIKADEILPVLDNLDDELEKKTKEIQEQKRAEKGRNNKKEIDLDISDFFENEEKEAEEIEEQNKKQLEEESNKKAEKENEQKIKLNDRLSKLDKFRDEDYGGSNNREIIIDSLKGSLDVIELSEDEFKLTIDEQWKICVNAEIEVIKEKLRELKFEEEDVEKKATSLASIPAIARDLSDAAKLPKNQDGNDKFATEAFKIKLKEVLPNASEEEVEAYIGRATDNIIDQVNKENKDGEIDQEETIARINKKLIDVASDSNQMKAIVDSVKIKSDEKDRFRLDPEQKEDLENKSKAIGESIENYLSAKKEDKTEAKKNLLGLLDPNQDNFPKHPTFELLAGLATDVLDDNKMKKKDGSSVKGRDEMLGSIGKEFLDLSKEENKKDAKEYEGVFENMTRSCAVIDKKHNQQEDGLTTRLSDRFSKSLEENKESLENNGLNLKKNLARVFKGAGFATLCAFGGPIGFVAGMIFLYLFRNLGEGKSPEEIQKEEELEKEKQEATISNMAMASRKNDMSETKKFTENVVKQATNNLDTIEENLEKNKEDLTKQDEKSKNSEERTKEVIDETKKKLNSSTEEEIDDNKKSFVNELKDKRNNPEKLNEGNEHS